MATSWKRKCGTNNNVHRRKCSNPDCRLQAVGTAPPHPSPKAGKGARVRAASAGNDPAHGRKGKDEWTCQCGLLNYKTREVCRGCAKPKPAGQPAPATARGKGLQAGQSALKDALVADRARLAKAAESFKPGRAVTPSFPLMAPAAASAKAAAMQLGAAAFDGSMRLFTAAAAGAPAVALGQPVGAAPIASSSASAAGPAPVARVSFASMEVDGGHIEEDTETKDAEEAKVKLAELDQSITALAGCAADPDIEAVIKRRTADKQQLIEHLRAAKPLAVR